MTPGMLRGFCCGIDELGSDSIGSFWGFSGAWEIAGDCLAAGGWAEMSSDRAAETARLARSISLSCFGLPVGEAFLRIVRFFATILLFFPSALGNLPGRV